MYYAFQKLIINFTLPILHFSRYKISIWWGKAADKAYERNDLYNYVEEWETNLLSKVSFCASVIFNVMIFEYANTLFFRWWSYVWSMESVYVNQGYWLNNNLKDFFDY